MKKLQFFLIACFCTGLYSHAQFGNFRKKEDLEQFKDKKMIVVLFPDSSFSESIRAVVEQYWNFTAFEFVPDTAIKKYTKGDEYVFLLFSKSMGSKNKAKLCNSEEDFNGLVISKKYRKHILKEDVLATAFCDNTIDTFAWYPQMLRGVQLLNNYCNYAIEAKSSGDLSIGRMMSNYFSDKSMLADKKLLIENKQLELQGKEDASTLYDGEVEEVDREAIEKAIMDQDNSVAYYYYSKDQKYCNKLVLSAANSELMYFAEASPDKCKCTAKDLKELKDIKARAAKNQK
jgi:hypothetical protein